MSKAKTKAIAKIQCAALAAAACLVGASVARADITFCNKFGHLVYVAIAYPQSVGGFLSRGWMSLADGDCNVFDSAIHVKTFYFRGESENYREGGRTVREFWGKGQKFAIWEKDNFQYYNAETRTLNSSLAEFTQGPEDSNGDVSATVTFTENGSVVTTK
jgi:hypothetical protein